MLEDFVYAFLVTLGEEEKIKDLSIKDKIIQDLIESDEDFNHVRLQHEESEWLLPLPNSTTSNVIIEKTVSITTYL